MVRSRIELPVASVAKCKAKTSFWFLQLPRARIIITCPLGSPRYGLLLYHRWNWRCRLGRVRHSGNDLRLQPIDFFS